MMNWNLDRAEFARLVADAIQAPSMHNSQPWQFRFTGEAIELLLDPDRVLPVSDPTARAARLSCGAALLNLRLALAVRGTPAIVAVRPDPREDLLLARLTPDAARPATPMQMRLYNAIPRRRSNRRPFADTPVPVEVHAQLVAAARDEGAWFEVMHTAAAVEAVADLVAAADRILNRDERYRAELRAWTRAAAQASDGVPADAGGPAPRTDELLVRRDFGGAQTQQEYERQSLIGVLGGFGDRPTEDLQVGVALQRILLTATDRGLACSMFSQPIDVPEIREQLQKLIGRHHAPHMVLRLGYAFALADTARRAADEVIVS